MSEKGGTEDTLVQIQVQLARQDGKLDNIVDKVAKIDAIDERLRRVEVSQSLLVSTETLNGVEARVRAVENVQAAQTAMSATRGTIQDGIVALIALVAGILGVNNG